MNAQADCQVTCAILQVEAALLGAQSSARAELERAILESADAHRKELQEIAVERQNEREATSMEHERALAAANSQYQEQVSKLEISIADRMASMHSAARGALQRVFCGLVLVAKALVLVFWIVLARPRPAPRGDCLLDVVGRAVLLRAFVS